MENTNYKINTIPSLTWNWMKINRDTIENIDTISDVKPEISYISDNLKFSTETSVLSPASISGIFNFENPKLNSEEFAPVPVQKKSEKTVKRNHDLEILLTKNCKTQVIEISKNLEKPLVLTFDTEEKSGSVSASIQKIIAKAESESTIILVYKNSANLIKTNVIAEENSKIHIIKVQLLPATENQADDTSIICNDNSKVSFTQIELGGKHIDSGLHVNLNGYQSTFNAQVAYLCKNQQYFDFNHIVDHYGKKTECKMYVAGTLKDKAVKTYRGTIDFKNGCSGAKGNEMEETLLLNPEVVNKSIPVILCDEEDVEGEHGSTIGRLSSDILFYMESRGIDEKSAEEIMSRAKIQAAADFIPDEAVKQLITDYFDQNNN